MNVALAFFAVAAAVVVADYNGTCPSDAKCDASTGKDAGSPCCQVTANTFECCYSAESCIPNVGCRCSQTGEKLERTRDYTGYDFDSFKAEFNKAYGVEEHTARKALFEATLAEVVSHNEEYKAGKHTWYKAVNHLSDWTEAEFQSMKAGKAHHVPSQHPLAQLRASKNPDRIDWRESSKVTAVKNQGGCGSCWAFSATEVVESHFAIASGKLLTLAPQTFVNCVQNPQGCGGTGGCEGATMELAFNLTVATGMALESDLPYKARDETCTAYKAAVKATGYVKLPENDAEALETAIATQGPVSVTVAANWGSYGGGIFSGGCTSTSCSLDHGVVAVGYDKTAGGEGYWLVRNSWGRSWGEAGYIRLSRKNDAVTFTDNNPKDGVACKPYPESQTLKGECGILFDTSYPTGVKAAADAAALLV